MIMREQNPVFTTLTGVLVFQVMVCAPAVSLTPWACPSCRPTVVRATAQPVWPPCAWRPESTRRQCSSLRTCSEPRRADQVPAWESCLESAWAQPGWRDPLRAPPSRFPALWGEAGTAPVLVCPTRCRCWAGVPTNTLTAPKNWRKSEALDVNMDVLMLSICDHPLLAVRN